MFEVPIQMNVFSLHTDEWKCDQKSKCIHIDDWKCGHNKSRCDGRKNSEHLLHSAVTMTKSFLKLIK